MVRNSAFVFLKPGAVTEKLKELVKETFEKKGIEVKKEGLIEAAEIDKKQLIDKHYYAIASKATLLTPDQLNIPKEKFKEKFELDWDEVLKSGKAINAKSACEKFELDADGLDKMWGAAKKSGALIKFGGGFYCAKLEDPKGSGTYYVFNGFFMSMRSKYVKEGASIYYYMVDWDPKALSWEDFRGKVLGPTDPADAPEDSLRGGALKNWKALGLPLEPNVGENCVHASASPFEGLAERMNWLGYRVERDPWGKMLLKTGVSARTVKEWATDPQVTYGIVPITKSLYDSLEDTDADYCLALCQMIGGKCEPPKPAVNLEKEVEKLKAEIEKYKVLEKAVAAIQAYVPPAPEKKEKKKKKEESTPEPAPAKGKGKAKEEPKGKGKGSGKEAAKGKEKAEPKGSGKASAKNGKAADVKGKSKGKGKYDAYEEKPPMRKGKGKGDSGGGGKGKGKSGKGKGKKGW